MAACNGEPEVPFGTAPDRGEPETPYVAPAGLDERGVRFGALGVRGERLAPATPRGLAGDSGYFLMFGRRGLGLWAVFVCSMR